MHPRKRILLADDDPEEIELTLLHLRELGADYAFETALDGRDVLARLRAGLAGADPLPDLVLMDLRMPGLSGDEVLAGVAADERLRRIPVVIMSNSGAEAERRRCLAEGAKAYLTKPVGLEQYKRLAELLGALLA